ncbi:hypothetical protein PDJAM_G00087380 [Pangasius djambal]|uniref:Uncharacterized protein n=1 Tax=Pangasius djambal TaxID=1691987 RepID=A0ACC5Z442_9TELE|nr:hypothetical protein [Pangasius djambal]
MADVLYLSFRLVLLLSSFTLPATGNPLPDITDPEFISSCVKEHNQARTSVSPPASNMRYMRPHPQLPPHWAWGGPACERRSLLMGISHGEPSRREIRSENHTRPGQNGATNNRRTPSQRTLSRTPGSKAIGGKAYRQSLGHVCTMASSPRGAG